MTKDDIAKLPTPRTDAKEWDADLHNMVVYADFARRLERENEAMRDALVYIGEYWNGGDGSAVDAAEECQQCAEETLAAIREYEAQP